MRAILLVLTSAACAGAPHAQEAAIGDPCDPERPCSSHFGLCIRCDAEGDPRWVWSDALGAVNGSTHDWNFTLSVFEPSCDEHTFDERGRPLTQQGAGNPDGERIAFRYDAERVVRVETDRPRMCPDDLAAEVQCGPPDGRPDQVLDVAYRADAESTVAEISSSGTVLATRRYDAHGRIVEIRTPRAVRRYEYDGGARASIEREEEDDRTAVVERDARGRIRRECAGTDCDGRDVRSQ
jgi:YD repeat-containing protein